MMRKPKKRKIRTKVLEVNRFSKTNNIFYRLMANQRFLAIVGLFILVVIIFPLLKTRHQQRLISREIEDVKAEIAAFESQSQEFAELKNYLQSEQSLEERARLNLNLRKPGEQLIVVNTEPPATHDFSVMPEMTISNLAKWWHYFFSL